jgi:Mg2+ and Co2+ transporter CorA
LKIACVTIEPGGKTRPESESVALDTWRAGTGTYWVDLDGGTPEENRTWLEGVGVDPGLLEIFALDEDETSILPLSECVYICYPALPHEDGVARYSRILCLERLIVTMHGHSTPFDGLIGTQIAKLTLREGTTAGILTGLALFHATALRRHVVRLRKVGDSLTDRMATDPWSVSPEEVLGLTRRVLAVGGLVDEGLAVLEVLRAIDKPALPLRVLAEPLQMVIEIMRATDRDVDRLDRRALALLRRHDSAHQDEVNHRLGRLTILSMIFMPLTLIVGIYGMNFDNMPELHLPYAYPVALASMAAIAGGLFWYSRSRGWLK